MRLNIRHKATVLITLVAVLFLCGKAQDPQEEQDKQEKKDETVETIRLDTDLVSIDVTVKDKSGKRGAAGLRAEDFVILEDGVRQKITNFSASDVPFNLTLLIDTSGSTTDDLLNIRRAARRFLEELRPDDRIAVVQFNRDVDLMQELTSNRSQIDLALSRFKPGGGTSFYDAFNLVLEDVFKKVEGRKAIVALTDGVDSVGFNTFDQILPELEKSGTIVYILELDTEVYTEARMLRDCTDSTHFEFSPKQLQKYLKDHVQGGNEEDFQSHCSLGRMERMQINRKLYQSARKELREMANKTGGRLYQVKDLGKLEPVYSEIAGEIRTQYSLGYYPTNEKHDGKWRTLRVEVRRPGYVGQTRPGYRAPLD
ncbi:MAG: VWA domain-containing protein [Acidobacteria bacterium]|nr:VWA domain-containing protein [Acidobacteriota bacterium]